MLRPLPALAVAALLLAASVPAPAQDAQVDLELVLAVDVSGSVDLFEGNLQRQGYIDALTSPKFLQAVANGRHGRIAVTYLEWAGWGIFRHLVTWTIIANADDAAVFTADLARHGTASYRGTSISSALDLSMQLFAFNPYRGMRRVIDVSGDGPNNQGISVTYFRDQAVAQGVTINGLPILADDSNGVRDLDVYYRECVIGGPGAFVIAAQNFESFAEAVLRKLILEVAQAPRPADPTSAHGITVQFLPTSGAPNRGPGPMFKDAPRYYPYCDIPNNNRPGTVFPVPGGF